MPGNTDENKPEESSLSKKIAALTAVIVALTGLITAVVHFRDSIPWLTPVNSIELTPNPVELAIGDKFQIVATVRDSNKNPLRKKVKWSIANPALLQIDNDGIVTGFAAGETNITASIGFVKGQAPVHVRRVTVATVDVFPPVTTLLVDDHLKFDATPYDSEGNSLIGRPVRWASENKLVADVDESSGEAMGKAAGTVKVRAESEGKSNAAQVTVSPKPEQPSTAPIPPPPPSPDHSNNASPASGGKRAKIGAAIGTLATDRPPVGAIVHLPTVVTASRAANTAFAEKIAIANGLKFGDCPANIRILVGESLIDLKSDSQEALHVPLGDVVYNLHGTISCPGRTVGAVNGRGTITIVSGKTYRCVWRQKDPKDFEITLQLQ
ncbi:MAG TPA: Ig-like domain-containing protein [Candidatus Acidoferrum sp.]|nr:Ig-like domain-containing protein [Candidatus Acidoferrum sp.]